MFCEYVEIKGRTWLRAAGFENDMRDRMVELRRERTTAKLEKEARSLMKKEESPREKLLRAIEEAQTEAARKRKRIKTE